MTAAPSYVAEAAADAVRAVARQVATPSARALADRADTIVSSPAELAAGLVAAIGEVAQTDQLEALAKDGVTLPAVPRTTANRRRQAANQTALVEFVRGAAVVELALHSAATIFKDRVSAVAARDMIGEILDSRSAEADTETFTAYRALRAAVAAHVSAIAADLPRVVTADPAAVLSSLVLAYSFYGGVARAGEIAARNGLPRPGFVPAQPIEVLV